MKRRLDQQLVERGLVSSREKAQALILAGEVFVDGQKAPKPGHAYSPDVRIELASRPPYVSRGGLKLAAALDHWQISAAGRVCADIGASTGGFTDCLLQRGAARVHTVDVGPSQLDWKIQSDPRVIVHDRTNARSVSVSELGETVSLLVCDVSFISVTLLLPAIVTLLDPAGEMVILVKPQFEAGRDAVGKGGIVRDPREHAAAVEKVRAAVAALGFVADWIDSPILGAEGNKEFLLHGRH